MTARGLWGEMASGAAIAVDLQTEALKTAGVKSDHNYSARVPGKLDSGPGLESCLKALRKGDMLIV